jgi:hypothetical protein
MLGLEYSSISTAYYYKHLISKQLIETSNLLRQFTYLLQTKWKMTSIQYRYPTYHSDFNFRETLIEDSYIIDHHLKRDRTEVEAARQRALQARHNAQ